MLILPLLKKDDLYVYYEIVEAPNSCLIYVSDVKFCDTVLNIISTPKYESYSSAKQIAASSVLEDFSSVLINDIFNSNPDVDKGAILSTFRSLIERYKYDAHDLKTIVDLFVDKYNLFMKRRML